MENGNMDGLSFIKPLENRILQTSVQEAWAAKQASLLTISQILPFYSGNFSQMSVVVLSVQGLKCQEAGISTC